MKQLLNEINHIHGENLLRDSINIIAFPSIGLWLEVAKSYTSNYVTRYAKIRLYLIITFTGQIL